MATRRTKNGDEEKIDPVNIERVIKLLEPTEPGVKAITKKDACDILRIAYNTTRLGKLLEAYKEKKKKDAERRAALRGKPASAGDIVYIISSYLEGSALDYISDSLYRSVAFIKNILIVHDVPIRQSAADYFKPNLIPEGAIRDKFKPGEYVYSARYDSVAKIHAEFAHKSGQWVYRIWLLSDKWKQFAYQEACELASLEHLEKLGVKF